MSEKSDKTREQEKREARLAENLRANLRRRKAATKKDVAKKTGTKP